MDAKTVDHINLGTSVQTHVGRQRAAHGNSCFLQDFAKLVLTVGRQHQMEEVVHQGTCRLPRHSLLLVPHQQVVELICIKILALILVEHHHVDLIKRS